MIQCNPTLFRDRRDAGAKLGQELRELAFEEPVVLAIPAGGVPVAKEIASILASPLDVVIARKIQFPWTTESGFGAVVEDGTLYLGPRAERLPQSIVKAQTQRAQQEVAHRAKVFRIRPPVALDGKTAILVDDGLATGSTMMAAVQSVRSRGPAKIFVAVPTASGTAVERLEPLVERIVALYLHPKQLPFAVASSYANWHDLTDEEVIALLGEGLR